MKLHLHWPDRKSIIVIACNCTRVVVKRSIKVHDVTGFLAPVTQGRRKLETCHNFRHFKRAQYIFQPTLHPLHPFRLFKCYCIFQTTVPPAPLHLSLSSSSSTHTIRVIAVASSSDRFRNPWKSVLLVSQAYIPNC